MTAAADVVVVPDFQGRARVQFEVRTLYLLASWLDLGPAVRHFPLHLACIGPPPESVCLLAEATGASVTVHEPAPPTSGPYANKLRGFEVEGRTGHLMLVDCDIVFLAGTPLTLDGVDTEAVSVAPADKAILPADCWEELYSALGIRLPGLGVETLDAELGVGDLALTYPSANSGVVLLPWRQQGLGSVWSSYHEVVMELSKRWLLEYPGVRITDQPALSAALESLRGGGVAVARLPDRLHGRWRHLYCRSVPLDGMSLLHMTGGFRGLMPGEHAARAGVIQYQRDLVRRFVKTAVRSQWPPRPYLVSGARFALDVRLLGAILRRLRHRYVLPALTGSPPPGS